MFIQLVNIENLLFVCMLSIFITRMIFPFLNVVHPFIIITIKCMPFIISNPGPYFRNLTPGITRVMPPLILEH